MKKLSLPAEVHRTKAGLIFLLLFGLIFMFSCQAWATIWYVSSEATAGGSGSQGNPFKTINSAEAAASSNDEIRVKQGTYSLIDTITLKSGVYLRGGYDGSWNQTGTTGTTTIDGQNNVRCMSGEALSAATTIENFTIKRGYGNLSPGGGLYLITNSSPTIKNCAFTSNGAAGGGGIRNDSSSPTITNCTFTSNGAGMGSGGGVYNYSSSSPIITNCTFTLNNGYNGGGVYNYSSSSPTITNCTFTSNEAAVNGGGICNSSSSNPNIKNSIIYGNTNGSITNFSSSVPTVTYSCIGGGYTGTGNIATDPLFVNAPSNVHLQASSPCKDTGTSSGAPSVDLDGISRPQGSGYDMGAYEFDPTIYVDAAVGGPGSGTRTDPFKTINSAEAAASSGKEIRVKQGTYPLTATITLKSGVYLRGGYDGSWTQTGTPGATAIDGGVSVRCMSGEALSAATTIENFTIENGVSAYGAGLYLTGSSPTIQNCIFTFNYGDLSGGGIYNGSSSSPTIKNCAFISNYANNIDGGGIYNSSSSPTIQNCTFESNVAGNYGGGIGNSSSSPIIKNCVFTSFNQAYYGGGIGNSSSSSPTITNCTFTSNYASLGSGLFNDSSSPIINNCTFTSSIMGGGICNFNSSNPTIKNTIDYGNTGGSIYDISSSPTVTYSCIQGGYTGTGNISAEPFFVNAPSNVRLLAGSPCIDSGTSVGAPSVDIDGISRPQGSGYDMGAYEYFAVESSYTTKVGTSGSWQWRKAQPGESVPSGTPAAWQWRTWEAGSLRKVPQGTAPAWNWGNE